MKLHTIVYYDVRHPGVGFLAIHMRVWASKGRYGHDEWGYMDSPCLAYKSDVATIHPPLMSPCKS